MEPYTYISVQGDFDVEGIAEQLRPVVEDYVEWVAHPEWQQPTDDSPAWELLDYHELCSVVEPFAGHYGSHGGGYDWDEDGEANLIREFQIELSLDERDLTQYTVVAEYVDEAADLQELRGRLEQALKEELNVTPKVRLVRKGELERTMFKAQRIVEKRAL